MSNTPRQRKRNNCKKEVFKSRNQGLQKRYKLVWSCGTKRNNIWSQVSFQAVMPSYDFHVCDPKWLGQAFRGLGLTWPFAMQFRHRSPIESRFAEHNGLFFCGKNVVCIFFRFLQPTRSHLIISREYSRLEGKFHIFWCEKQNLFKRVLRPRTSFFWLEPFKMVRFIEKRSCLPWKRVPNMAKKKCGALVKDVERL